MEVIPYPDAVNLAQFLPQLRIQELLGNTFFTQDYCVFFYR